MQPHKAGERRQSVQISSRAGFAAGFATAILLPVVAAVVLATTLLLSFHMISSAAPARLAPPAAAAAWAMAQDQNAGDPGAGDPGGDPGGGDDGGDPGGGDGGAADDDIPGAGSEGRGKRDEIVGVVVAVPANSPAGFVGDWRILIASRTALTVTVTAETEIDDDFDRPPGLGDWVQVRGARQPDGSVLAKRLRPNEFESGEVVVRLAPAITTTQAISLALARIEQRFELEMAGALLASANIYLFSGDDDIQEDNVLQRMTGDPTILWAELNYVSEVPSDPEGNPYRTWKWGGKDDTGYQNQAALQQVNLAPAVGRYGGEGVIVAVLDTGIYSSHPAFVGRLLAGRDMVSDDAAPQDGPEAGEEPGLAQGHGTHVSGVIARIAPQSKILPVRVLDVNGRGNTYVLAYAIEWAAANGADVINLSLGADFDSNVLSDTVAAAQRSGVVIVAAAGNDSGATPQYPANFPGVLGVTAVDEGDHKADFANYGAAWVDLASPGVGITSAVPLSGEVLYAAWSGTSMATPFVTGAVALLKQQQPGATAQAVAAQLIATGRELDSANPLYAGQLGRMLDIGAALGLAIDAPGAPATPVAPALPPTLYLPALLRPN